MTRKIHLAGQPELSSDTDGDTLEIDIDGEVVLTGPVDTMDAVGAFIRAIAASHRAGQAP